MDFIDQVISVRKSSMSLSSLITMSTSRCFILRVTHYQLKKGISESLILFISIEFTCFLSIQNLELKPPYTIPEISLSKQEADECLLLNSSSSFTSSSAYACKLIYLNLCTSFGSASSIYFSLIIGFKFTIEISFPFSLKCK
jgi:hypothetical protein